MTQSEQALEAPAGDSESPDQSFEQLDLRPELLRALHDMGFERPTTVQQSVLPHAIAGRDLLVQSRTGSGKTAAFCIPLCQSEVKETPGMQALVLCPTRELALQVAEQCSQIAAHLPLQSTAIYGGAAFEPQVQALAAGKQIIAGTPGRVLDHLRRGTMQADGLKVLVLDEADEMLSMGFQEELNAIVDCLPDSRQTWLFSATIPKEIERLAERLLKDPECLFLSEDFVGVREIEHIYYLVRGADRLGDLSSVLEFENPQLGLIFCNTRNDTAAVAGFLSRSGFAAEAISSDLTQRDRERVMRRMRNHELRFLVATDIAARGIDIADVTHVINFSFPESADVYVHRTGRTGRAGKSGVAISLVSPREIGSFYYLRLIHKIFPEERHLPSPQEIAARREGEDCDKLRSRFSGQTADDAARSLARRVWSRLDGEELVALAIAEILGRAVPTVAAVKVEDDNINPDRDKRPTARTRNPRRVRQSSKESGAEGTPVGSASAEGDRKRRRRRSPVRAVDEDTVDVFTTSDGEEERFESLGSPGKDSTTESQSPAEDEQSVRLYVNVGRRHGIRRADLSAFVSAEGQLDAAALGEVVVRDRHTYISVPSITADALIERLNGKVIADRKLKLEYAKR